MENFLFALLNGLSFGLLLFLLSAGLTLIFSLMGVLNFAHASFYMIGAYLAYTVGQFTNFWTGIVVAPFLVGLVGAAVEKYGLRRLHQWGHVQELLFTFGLSFIVLEAVQLVWGKSAVPYRVPPELDTALFRLYSTSFPAYRGFMMLVSLCVLAGMWLVLARTKVGLVIRAALTHPKAVECLGHDVPSVFVLVFAAGAGLAGLAGAIGGPAFVTEPGMAAFAGSILFVIVVIGGLGSLTGAFIASILIGVMQTFAVQIDVSLATVLGDGVKNVLGADSLLATLKVSQIAPMLPYLLLVVMLVVRPRGLMGTRET